MKYQYRITKYNPKYRDKEQGYYLRDEWTSICDIGKKFNNKIFTKSEYQNIETAYIKSIIIFMSENNITSLQLIEYENHQDFKTDELIIKNNTFYNKEQVELLARFILREHIWGKLIFENQIFVHFGYDYYMYIGLDEKFEKELKKVQKLGLFAEKFKSPYYEQE